MPSIIKKGTNASSFQLSNRMVVLEPDIITLLSDSEYDELMDTYGSFIEPRQISDKNPGGCFILHKSSEYAKDQSSEVGKVEDGSSPIDGERFRKKWKKNHGANNG